MCEINERKRQLRRELLVKRKALPDKTAAGAAVTNRIQLLPEYRQAESIFIYVNKKDELETTRLIDISLKSGKTVNVPLCVNETEISFYTIQSLTELRPGAFGLLEPNPAVSGQAAVYDRAICLVPGLAFDKKGYRIGYGRGYYDRFLENTVMFSAGLCYEELLCEDLPIEPHDRHVDVVVTQAHTYRVGRKEK